MSKQLFADLGFSEDEAREQAIRSEIAAHISMLIKNRNLRQKDAAKLFRVPQPTVSKIVKGDLSRLSLAYLVRMLIRADLPFSIVRNKASDEVNVLVGDNDSTSTNFGKVDLGQSMENHFTQDVTMTGQG